VQGVRGEDLTFPTYFSGGEPRLKVHSGSGRGMAAAGLGMQICKVTSTCAHSLHGVSWSLNLNPYMEGPAKKQKVDDSCC